MFAACSLSKLQTPPSLRSLMFFWSKSPSVDRFSQISLCKAAESVRDFSLSAAAISVSPPHARLAGRAAVSVVSVTCPAR